MRRVRSARGARGERSVGAGLLIELPLEVAQVGGVWRIHADLVEEGKDVVKGSDGVEGRCVLGAEGAPYGGEEEGRVDLFEQDAAVVEGRGKSPVFRARVSEGAGGAAVVVEDGLDVDVAVHECAQPWGSLSDGPSMVTV